MGTSLHFIPRLASVPLAHPRWIGGILWLMGTGLLLRVFGQPALPYLDGSSVLVPLRWLVAASGVLEGAGILLYLFLLIKTLRGTGDISTQPAFTAVRPYYEVGTILTPNHGHAAMMGVFGMLAIALAVFALRQVLADREWVRVERYIRLSFWGLNIGLALMVIMNLFPGGVLQLWDVLQNGYWHARGPEFLNAGIVRLVEWLRLPADLIFIGLGVFPLLAAMGMAYRSTNKTS